MDSDYGDFTCARLQALLRCILPSGDLHDIAVVRLFKSSSWKPNTEIDGCAVLKEAKDLQFVMVKYLIRGAHMIPIFDIKTDQFILNDLIDPDMFLRTGN
jgi:hypothetical protein